MTQASKRHKFRELQLLESLLENEKKATGVANDVAFTNLVYQIFISQELDPNDFTDGIDDKGIDVLAIQEYESCAIVYIIQTKATTTFSANEFTKLSNGLEWLTESRELDYKMLRNKALVDKISEFRSVQNQFGQSGIKIRVIFATKGNTKEIQQTGDLQQQKNMLIGKYKDRFGELTVDIVGAREIIAMKRQKERKGAQIDAELLIVSSSRDESRMKYKSRELEAIVFTTPGTQIADIVNRDPDGHIFDLNVRRYLGEKGNVNKEIYSTCISADNSHQFWHLNNGITIVCDFFNVVPDTEKPFLKLTNMQIVNGCQTAETLAKAQKEDRLQPNVEVLVRVYKTSDTNVIDKIVLSTNNQNKIGLRNLKANDLRQIQLEEGFRLHHYFYERKPHQYEKIKALKEKDKILSNEIVGQAVLAVVHRTPSDSRARKYKIWSELYERVFSDGPIEPFVISSIFATKIQSEIRKDPRKKGKDIITRVVIKKGLFHLLELVVYRAFGKDLSAISVKKAETYLDSSKFTKELKGGIRDLVGLLKKPKFRADPDRALKSSEFDREVEFLIRNKL